MSPGLAVSLGRLQQHRNCSFLTGLNTALTDLIQSRLHTVCWLPCLTRFFSFVPVKFCFVLRSLSLQAKWKMVFSPFIALVYVSVIYKKQAAKYIAWKCEGLRSWKVNKECQLSSLQCQAYHIAEEIVSYLVQGPSKFSENSDSM